MIDIINTIYFQCILLPKFTCALRQGKAGWICVYIYQRPSVGFFFIHFHAVAPISTKCAVIAADIPGEIFVISDPQILSSNKYPTEIWKVCLLLLENQSITEYNHEKPQSG